MNEQQPTLRDQFAMAALIGLYVSWPTREEYDCIAEWAYEQADAMLKAREQKQ